MAKTILLIDDDRTLTTLLKSFLSEAGYNVRVSADGDEALEQLDNLEVDLIILDIQMPKLNGYSFLFDLKKKERGQRVPVIVLTCKEGMEDIFKVEGVKEYLIKPLGQQQLLEKVRQYIQS